MLPRISSEVQYHPMKLKKKIIYKSNYMYNFICKDVVAAVIKWLKENNQIYGNIEINDQWADDWINSDFSTLMNECGEDGCSSDDQPNLPTTSSESTTEISMGVSDTDNNTPDSNITSISLQSTIEINMEVSDTDNNTPDKNITNDVILEEKELEEDCVAAVKSMTLTGEPTANMLQFENLENEIYTCAPGENNIPCYMLMDDEFEILAFPDMFNMGLEVIVLMEHGIQSCH